MVNAHDTCLNFQDVADLSFLNSYVRLAKLRGIERIIVWSWSTSREMLLIFVC